MATPYSLILYLRTQAALVLIHNMKKLPDRGAKQAAFKAIQAAGASVDMED
jgi:hypothetical protein